MRKGGVFLKKAAYYLATAVCAMGMLVFSHPADASISLEINQRVYQSEPSPELISGRVYVPLRTISEGLGYHVDWDGVHQAVIIKTGEGRAPATYTHPGDIGIYINSDELHLNEKMGRPFIKAPGYTMIPLRAVSETLGADVVWNNGTVRITRELLSDKANQTVVQEHLDNQKEVSTGTVQTAPLANEDVSTASSEVFNEPADGDLKDYTGGDMTIFGDAIANLSQVNQWLKIKEAEMQARARSQGKTFVPFPDNIGFLYLTIGQKYGIRGDVALAQAVQETGYFQFGNEVLPEQNNYCGLGAIGRVTTQEDLDKQVFSNINPAFAHLEIDKHGWFYATPAVGVEAHIQHLYSYATSKSLPTGYPLYDGRFNHGNRGVATVWNDLNGRWAVPGNGYGDKIVDIWHSMVQ